MATKLDKVMESERKVQLDLIKANQGRKNIVDSAIESATLEVNDINLETDQMIKKLLHDKKERINEIELELETVVKRENERISKKVSDKKVVIVEQIYKEAIGND